MPKEDKKTINTQDKDLAINHLTIKDIRLNDYERLDVIHDEFKKGFDEILKYPKSVTFFGSARFKEDHPYYQKAVSLGKKIAEAGFAVVTGGGPGIMEGGNRGAKEGGENKSIGFSIELPMEQVTNPYVTKNIDFHYFFSRKVLMSFSAEAYIYFPGGFGTMDEFFEIITLVQTNKIPKVPIILVGNEFWGKLNDFIKETLLEKYKTIDGEDMDLYRITEDEDEILEIVKNAPLRNE